MRASAPPARPALTEAAAALQLVQVDPERARLLAGAVLEGAGRDDGEAASMAERAMGLAAKELNDLGGALAHLRRAVRVAERHQLATRAAQARMSLSLALAYHGDTAGALREADRAAAVLRGADAARLQGQRALVLQRLGRWDEALDGYRRALPVLRREGDRLWEARLRSNRGVIHAYQGALGAAEADLRRAEGLCLELGQALLLTHVRHNLGFVEARRGNVPAALARYDQADEAYRGHGGQRGMLLLDRCELLLDVRLIAEARAAAEEAVRELGRGGMAADVAEARLMAAQAALLDGDVPAARAAAAEARQAFARQRRPSWAVLARYTELRARWEIEEGSAALLAAARRTADALAQAGWGVASLHARIIAARVALGLGRARAAEAELAVASSARRNGPANLRARAWHGEALLRAARGDRRGAQAALRAGVRVLDRYQAALGATELRARASAEVGELAELGLRFALEAGQVAGVLGWSERWRAGALRFRPARPSDDARLAGDLVRLREVAATLSDAALHGRDVRALLRRQAELEEAIRRRAHHAPGVRLTGGAPPSPAALSARLGEQALVELVACAGRLDAVVVAGGRARLRRIGPLGPVVSELDSLRFALRRLALGHGSAASLAAAWASAAHAARQLDAVLLRPLERDLGDRELVVVPTGALHALPWSMLPSCSGRAVVVCPSATTWQRVSARAGTPAQPPGAAVFVAGPGLAHAEPEVATLRRRYPRAKALSGERATVAAVLAALDGADLAHLATHGHFRADNPLFSSLRLVDGPMTVYDLERLERAPRRMVLSACESALSTVSPGDELMGLAAALLALGTQTLIASVVPVADEATRSLMLAFHAHLRRGERPARALALAQQAASRGRYSEVAAAAGFVCFGAG